MTYCEYCYAILKDKSEGLDAVYEDYIVNLIGVAGLTELRSNRLLESCGSVNGRALYTLIKNTVLK